MTLIDEFGYVRHFSVYNRKRSDRNWFLVKQNYRNPKLGDVYLGLLSVPKKLIGKRVKIKIQIETIE